MIDHRADPHFQIDSLSKLAEHERAIIDLINNTINGGHLFLAHPFLLLKDVGVELTPAVEQALLKRYPEISGCSKTVYSMLKNAPAQKSIVNVQQLFHAPVRNVVNPEVSR